VLSGGGFTDPASESERAARLLDTELGAGVPNLALLGHRARRAWPTRRPSRPGAPSRPGWPPSPGVEQVVSWWTAGRPESLASRDGDQAVVLAR
jgi:RND superfamily putative drug exporter